MLRVILLGLALLYIYYPLIWRILWLAFYYCCCSCFLFLFLYCYGKTLFFIHWNFFCQKYKFTLLLVDLWSSIFTVLHFVFTELSQQLDFVFVPIFVNHTFGGNQIGHNVKFLVREIQQSTLFLREDNLLYLVFD